VEVAVPVFDAVLVIVPVEERVIDLDGVDVTVSEAVGVLDGV
jgi:hypothetical protein